MIMPKPRNQLAKWDGAAKYSNQADLHLSFIEPLHRPDMPRRPSLTAMPLVRIGRDQSMIFGPLRRAVPTSVHRGMAAETVVAVPSGVGTIDDDGCGDGPSDWALNA